MSILSVAVVITGIFPSISDTLKVKLFAPPKWPETKLIENLLHTSTTTTAGSLSLLTKYLDTALTAIPVELINIIELYFSKHFFVILSNLKFLILDFKIKSPPSISFIFSPKISPFSITLIIQIIIIL